MAKSKSVLERFGRKVHFWGFLQLESIAKISNMQYVEVLQSYGNPIL